MAQRNWTPPRGWLRQARKLTNKMMTQMVDWFVTGRDTDDHVCGHCSMRIESETPQCTVVGDSRGIDLQLGTCIYWAFGDTASEADVHESRMPYDSAGYVQKPDASMKIQCGTCDAHYQEPRCTLWGGDVEATDCCTAYENPLLQEID